ncbi:MAG: D-alanyl-D-alanine carboxypeptidase family protein, partial [Gammaproteobacteria bacterium]
ENTPDIRLDPASLTKLMTAYVVFHALDQGQISLEDQVNVSEKAWRTEGSRMFIEVDTRVRLEDLMRGMIIQSGNDASVALAEHVAGAEETFAALMNEHAQILGMRATSYRNSTGLPFPDHYTTARDAAILARAIITEFPDYYGLYSEREFTYNDIRQHNRNSLLWRDTSVDGMKTGYTEDAGYCLVTSAERSGMRLISVVMGMATAETRISGSQALLNYGFRFYETHRLYAEGEEITTARVWGGNQEMAALGLTQDLFVTIPRGSYETLSANIEVQPTLIAPLVDRAAVGQVRVFLDGEGLLDAPLVTLHPVEEGSFWTRLKDELTLWLR